MEGGRPVTLAAVLALVSLAAAANQTQGQGEAGAVATVAGSGFVVAEERVSVLPPKGAEEPPPEDAAAGAWPMDFLAATGDLAEAVRVPAAEAEAPGNETRAGGSSLRGVTKSASAAGPGAEAGAGRWQALLDRHNMYRRRHRAPPLAWDSQLASAAQGWVDRCVWRHSRMGYGENLYGGSDPEMATTAWYNEASQYDYNSPGFSMATGHFTQVVWVGSSRIGCAVRRCPNLSFKYVMACEYDPPGNYKGQFRANVLPPSGGGDDGGRRCGCGRGGYCNCYQSGPRRCHSGPPDFCSCPCRGTNNRCYLHHCGAFCSSRECA